MAFKRSLCCVMIVIIAFNAGTEFASALDIRITSPANGIYFNETSADVRGTANGSEATWSEGGPVGYDGGRLINVLSDSGRLFLDRPLFDDFGDERMNGTGWEVTTAGSISVSEQNGVLAVKGKNTNSGLWEGKGLAVTYARVSNWISADLVTFSGSGSGYDSMLTLYQDGSNYILIGKCYDAGAFGSPVVCYVHYVINGVTNYRSAGTAASGTANYQVRYDNGTATLYQNNVQIHTQKIQLTSPRCMLMNLVRSSGDTIDATWDNVRCYYHASGSYTSSIYDTGASELELNGIRWSADIPQTAELAVEARSFERSDMGSPTCWTRVCQNQTTGLPKVGRYLQYRVTMSGNSGLVTPFFKRVEISYRIPIQNVAVSTDNRSTWTAASGSNNWSASIHLPDGKVNVVARVTDAAGTTSEDSIDLTVRVMLPVVLISYPGPNSKVKGTITANGTAFHTDARRNIASVKVKVDDGDWIVADGTLSWAVQLNTKQYSNGRHVLRAISSDGVWNSTEVPSQFIVTNGRETVTTDPLPCSMFIFLMLSAAGVSALLYFRARSANKEDVGMAAGRESRPVRSVGGTARRRRI
jgi:hypothetical protein